MLDVLREQSRYFKTSQLYEVLKNTIINECSISGLIKSENWEHVLFAKSLYHWQFVLDNILDKLTKTK